MPVTVLADELQCTGCGACQNICPQNAVAMGEGYHTFSYPQIDEKKCIECQRCRQVCPVNNYENENNKEPEVIAVQALDEIRETSSSGGVFTVISNYIIKNGGCVFGTAWNEEFQAKFIKAEGAEDIIRCKGSKYVQSDVGFSYRAVKAELKKDRMVAFTGCPCQIAGLKNYLGKEYENLILIDLICHGVPSQKLLDFYLEGHQKEQIKDVRFRDKELGWRADAITIIYQDAERYVRSLRTEDEYEIGFQKNIILRDSCESCKFCAFPRTGDISIGDFWGINQWKMVDGKGTSMLFINNEKGKKFLDEIISNFQFSQKMEIPLTSIKNRINKQYDHSPYKNLFFELLKKYTFAEAIKRANVGKFDIGIVGIPTVENFGGTLTYVGLYQTLKEMGYICAMIERPLDCKHPPLNINRVYHESPFEEGVLISNVAKRSDLRKLNDKADIFLVGSDQLFHDNLMTNFSQFALLDWVSDNKRKIAYAASFGHEQFTGSEYRRAEMSYYLKKFDAFSVREDSGVELAKKEFGIEAVQVLDPVFLCKPEIYKEMVKKAKKTYEGDYISAYILDPNPKKEKMLNEISQILRMPLKVYTEMFYTQESIKEKWNQEIEIGKIEDRLSCIYNSKFLVTDSFHGTCFALIFEKNFIAINNKGRGSTRFESVLKQVDLMDRLIEQKDTIESDSLLFSDINYKSIKKILDAAIDRDKIWLKEQLQQSYKKAFSERDIIVEKLDYENKMLRQQLINLQSIIKLGYVGETNIFHYLEKINCEKNHLLIIITAKDTPGMGITDHLATDLKMLGIEADIKKAHWCGFISVLSKGKVIYEECRYQEKLEYETVIDSLELKAVSAPLRFGNDSETWINTIPYSVKSRGLNFVIYDFNYSCVTDSVGFDTHERHFIAKRKQ